MPDPGGEQRPHLFVEGRARSHRFTPPRGWSPRFTTPQRDRVSHADWLIGQLDLIRQKGEAIRVERRAAGLSTNFGLVIELASDPGFALKVDSLERIVPPSLAANAVCLLDSGINHGHPLLEPVVPPDGLQTLHPAWGTADDPALPHGTMMAGLAGYGELTHSLATDLSVGLSHWVESVKMVQTGLPHQPHLYGDVTRESVGRIEVAAPLRPRVFSMQVTSEVTADRGRPTSWSAALDQICAGAGEESNVRRLVMVSAGNVDITHPVSIAAAHDHG